MTGRAICVVKCNVVGPGEEEEGVGGNVRPTLIAAPENLVQEPLSGFFYIYTRNRALSAYSS